MDPGNISLLSSYELGVEDKQVGSREVFGSIGYTYYMLIFIESVKIGLSKIYLYFIYIYIVHVNGLINQSGTGGYRLDSL